MKENLDDMPCCHTKFVAYSSYRRPCGRPGKVEREGKWYCGIHDPERVAKRDEETRARWDRQSKARNLLWDANELCQNLVATAAAQNSAIDVRDMARAILAKRLEADELEKVK